MSGGLAQLKKENHPKPSLCCPHLWLSPIFHPAPLAETPGITNLQVNPGTVEFWRRQSTTLATVAPKSWLIPPKNWEMDAPLSPALPTNIPGAPPSTAQASGKCSSWEEITPRASYGKEEHEDWEYFLLWWENTQPAPFPPFPPNIATKQEKVLAVISISLENARWPAQLPDPALQKIPEWLQASGSARINIKNLIFLPKRKGWKLLRLGIPSGMEYLLQDADPKRIMSHHCLHHLWGSAAPTLGNAALQGIPGDSWDPTGSGCFAGHAGTCPPAERTNKLLSHSKTMKAKPQSPKAPLSHSPAAATAPQPSQNSPPPAAADPCSKGPLQRRWEAFPSRESLSERGQDGWRS
ncbi:uncharacterized protein LOC108962556 [Serinus canaria]|uniref:uncharacterized protein LOC108962556 n=1 Tax=Serinus canaria TaxID=9135 RepID=UPI0021CD16C6|nr:uncharacterized protein LOC108962556 [Serinus canaria]